MSGRSVLADVNVWLASIVDSHPHHTAAAKWWEDEVLPSSSVVSFCRVTQLGLLRLLTNERVMGKRRRGVQEAWTDYHRLLAQPPVAFASEPPEIESVLGHLCQGQRSSKNYWTDAYLAAFARAAGMKFATFDRGFRKFKKLDLIHLH